MLYTLFAFLAALLFLPQIISAHSIEVPAGKKECFFEDLHVNDKVCIPVNLHTRDLFCLQMTVSYQVGGGGHLDIDFWVWLSII
jgi:hypothetical protein